MGDIVTFYPANIVEYRSNIKNDDIVESWNSKRLGYVNQYDDHTYAVAGYEKSIIGDPRL